MPARLTGGLYEFKRRDCNLQEEYRRYRSCGTLLLFMDIVLAGFCVLIALDSKGYDYPRYLIYAMVAMLSLETAIIGRFGTGQTGFRFTMTELSGVAVCLIVFIMAVVMMVRSGSYINGMRADTRNR
ncbi:hypothetical protein [Bifidobacterium thermophilum]|uniref:hypothetical protein n=1 Tax=Bifidobacterium thermophilum TaxID=33905 RepID=UPI0030AAE1E0